jgi:hypothetical protein
VIAAMLLVAGAPLVVLAQTSTNPNPAASPETSTAPGKLNDQEIKTRLESLGYTQVKDILSTPKGITAKAMKGDKAITVVTDSARQGHSRDADRTLRLCPHAGPALATRLFGERCTEPG